MNKTKEKNIWQEYDMMMKWIVLNEESIELMEQPMRQM